MLLLLAAGDSGRQEGALFEAFFGVEVELGKLVFLLLRSCGSASTHVTFLIPSDVFLLNEFWFVTQDRTRPSYIRWLAQN